MKRSLKLFNKIGQKPRRRQDIMDMDDEYSGDDFEEDYDDGYDEDDYPDEEFEREYGDSDEEYADAYEDPDEYDDEYEGSDEGFRRERDDYKEEDDRGFDGYDDYGEDFVDERDYREADETDFREVSDPENNTVDHDFREVEDTGFREEDISEERFESDSDYREDDYGDDYEDADRRYETVADSEEVVGDTIDLGDFVNVVAFKPRAEQVAAELEDAIDKTAGVETADEPEDDYYRDEDAEYEDEEEYAEEDYAEDEEYEDEDYAEDEEYEDEDYEGDDYEDGEYDEDYEGEYDEDYDGEYDEDYEDERDRVAAGGRGFGRGGRDGGRGGRGGRSGGRGGRRGGPGDGDNRFVAAMTAAGGKIVDFVKESSFVERAAAIAGILILVAAIVTISFYSKALGRTKEISEFAEVGTNLDTADVVGASGLLAVADAERARAMAAEIIEEEEEEEVVAQETQSVTINMTLTSIKSDIKVKFINAETSKLVADVPFVITVVTPDGTSVTYDDHDRDGIIYKKDMTAGKYKITPNALPAEYSDYKLDTSSKTLTVKDTVEMKAVDVSNEIKKESQVNAAKEDTAVQNVVESELKDTVDWDGESYSTDGEGGDAKYEEVDKSEVDPASLTGKLSLGSVMRLSAARAENDGEELGEENQNEEETEEKGEIELGAEEYSLSVGGTAQISASADSTIRYKSNDSSVATVSDSGFIEAKGKGETTIVVSADNCDSKEITVRVSGGDDEEQSEEKKDEKSEDKKDEKSEEKETGKIKLSSDEKVTLKVGETSKITVTDSSIDLNYSSDDESVATVDGGTIKAVGEGSTKITIFSPGYDSAYVSVTVKKDKDSDKDIVPLKITSFTIHERKTEKITSTDSSLKLKFKSDNTKVATVSDGVVTGVSAGTANITVSADGYKDATVVVTVIHKELKDKNGNTLYVLEDGKYRVAVFADYDTAEKFYKKTSGSKKYHGWATIDGKTYFFDNSGNMVTGEQVIGGAKYTFGSDGVLSASSGTLGIDVSKWNGNIDWSKVKNSGVNFVIIRCGYRGSSAGALIEDPKFKANIKGATSAGLRVGVYFFSQAVNEVEAVEEASMCINLVKGYSLSFPIYIDVEGSNGRGDAVSTSQRTANIKAFCGTIQNAGYTPGVYANKTWFTSKINTSQITGYKIWLAQYAASVTYNASRYDMWQYTSKGSVSGISGKVDMNILYR